ncbi:MAG: type II TA system antitoxin MqsA family protein, partial [Hyphomicrobium sp.]
APFHYGGGRDQASKLAVAQVADPERTVRVADSQHPAPGLSRSRRRRDAPLSRYHPERLAVLPWPGDEFATGGEDWGERTGRNGAANPWIVARRRAELAGDLVCGAIEAIELGQGWKSCRLFDHAAIELVRKKLRLDQREAAEPFGGGTNAFSRYENGKTKPPLALVKLLKALDRHRDLLTEVRAG